jgi:uncharacterized protein (DUF58 family)
LPSVDRERVLEGDTVTLTLSVAGRRAPTIVDLELRLPAGLQPVDPTAATSLRVAPGEAETLVVPLHAVRWGGYLAGGVRVRARDGFGLFLYEDDAGRPLPIRVYPDAERLRTMVRPNETQAAAGNLVSRLRGEGIEFADVRPFHPGDRVRHVNWRVSARRGELHVNEQHPERNADVVLFLDTFAGAGQAGASTLDHAVRAASALAARYLRDRDRVGLMGFGGILRWLRPGMGLRQQYRLLETLVEAEIVASYAWKALDVIPPGVLPAKALVVALTPLIDDRAVNALLDIRARGFDVAVVEVDPVELVDPPHGELEGLARRAWRLHREAVRRRFRAAGMAVAGWSGGGSPQPALEEIEWLRRRSPAVRA